MPRRVKRPDGRSGGEVIEQRDASLLEGRPSEGGTLEGGLGGPQGLDEPGRVRIAGRIACHEHNGRHERGLATMPRLAAHRLLDAQGQG